MAQNISEKDHDRWLDAMRKEFGKPISVESSSEVHYPKFDPKKPVETLGQDTFIIHKFNGNNRLGVFAVEFFLCSVYKNDDKGYWAGNLSETLSARYLDASGQEINLTI